MTRNSILVAILVVVLGLGGGLWLALTPDGDRDVAAPQPTPAGGGPPEQTPEQAPEQTGEQTGEQAEQQAGQAEPASPQPVPSQPDVADPGQTEEELAEAEAPADQAATETVETPVDDEEIAALADTTEDAAVETEVAEETAAEMEVAEDIATEDIATEDTATEEAASEETASEEAASEETAFEETAFEETASEETASEETASEETAAGETQASLPTPEPPSFDIVRVEKDGSTVVAGRAPPGSTVTLYDGDTPLASAEADASGSFVLILEAPLPPGSRVLTLSAEQDGTTVASLGEVVVVVPEPAQGGAVQSAASGEEASDAPSPDTAPDTPIVVATDGQGASVVLQAPGDLDGDTLRIEAVDYDLDGQVVIAGRGPAGGTVALYLDQVPLGQARIDAEGRWRFTPEGAVEPGLHRLRADLLTADGQVAQRAEIPFSRAEPIQIAADEDFVVVQPGNSLWVIARGKYGRGIRYTAIYEANAGQIRDPDLIYPGQIFLIPEVN